MKKTKSTALSPAELKMRSDLDVARRDLKRVRAQLEASEHEPAGPSPSRSGEGDAAPVVESASPQRDVSAALEALQREVADLTQTRTRLSRLYFQQVEENRKRQAKLNQVLQHIWAISAERDLGRLLQRLADTLCEQLGFRIALIRLREPGTQLLKASASAGLDDAAREERSRDTVTLEQFQSWLKDEFRVSRSYFISHRQKLNQALNGFTPDLGVREEWEWHRDDMLLVPVTNQSGELVAYFSVDDPIDRLVPSRESIEMLEVFASHAAVAIENARLVQQLERHTLDLEAAGVHMQEMHALKSNFISSVSHELRTPLTAIRAYVDTLLAAREGDMSFDQARKFLGIVNDETHRLSRLIESMLDLNRFDSGTLRLTRQAVPMVEVVEDAVGLLKAVAETGQVALKLQNAVADTSVEADRDQMKQLVLHLGGNAVKFTPAGGQVTFRLSGDDRDIMLEVEDNGIGIAEPQLEKIFERFYQVDSSLARRYGGTGLGLAICKSIVESHGGRIFAESASDMGSRFTVVLPRRSGPRAAVRAQGRAAHSDVLRLAIEMVSEVMSAHVVSLMAPDESGELVIQAAVGLDEAVLREGSLPPGRGVAGWVAEHRRPVCVSNPHTMDHAEMSGARTTGSYLSVPLEGSQGLLGVLSVTDRTGERPFDADDCYLLLHLAERVAAAWEEAAALERSRHDVEGTTRALRRVLEHLEQGRRTAPDRVRLARALARDLGLAETEVGLISYAASVHDLGMSRVAPEVQDGATPLSPDARASLEKHPELSAELLRPLEAMGVVREVVLTHHEWWDGTGYPRGLRGEEIPVGGRILAVVDAYESMTVGRSHRAALPHAKALAELNRLRGRQFDPAVVDAFERAWSAVEREKSGAAPEHQEPAAPAQGR